ncbi:MAG TPA: hypothetical protein VJ840_01505 [Gemmatimonadaceae bacterium]|nr:hypothetical protein [Gemmatimonadaceae bacterium]
MKKALFVLAVAGFVLAGCKSAVAPSNTVILAVDKVQVPATTAATTPLYVVLTVLRGACQTFGTIQSQRGASGLTLTVYGTDPQKGCIDLGISEPHTFRIEPPLPVGTFTIVVNRGRLSPLIATVQVE